MVKPTIVFAGMLLCIFPCTLAATIPRVTRPSTAFTPASLQPSEPATAISSTYNLVEELSAWSDLSALVRLVTLFPDLVEAALSEDPFLVFAPTNDAFLTVARVFLPDTPEDADTDTIVTALAEIFEKLFDASPDLPGVKDVLTYHLVAGDLSEEAIVTAKTLATVLSAHLNTKSYPGKIGDVDPTVDSKRLGRQIKTTNGRVSFIDNVLIPFNVGDALSKAGVTLPLSSRKEDAGDLDMVFKPFQSLVDFVTSRIDLTVLTTLAAGSELLLDVLSNSPSLHVFAPTDRSFLALAAALVPEGSDIGLLPEDGEAALGNVKELADFASRLAGTWAQLEGVPSLEQIVAYHVLDTSNSYSELVGTGHQETLFGGDARIVVRDKGVRDDDPDRGDAPLIASFATGNGFVSVIDDVLLPFPASMAIEIVAAALGESEPPKDTKAPTPSKEPETPPEEPVVKDFLPAALQPTSPALPISSTYDLVQELSAWSDLSVLLRLVTTFPDLVEAAASADPFLVFAPTNEAFLTVARVFLPDTPEDSDTDTIVTALGGIFETLLAAAPDLPDVKDVLTYHLVGGDLSEEQIATSGSLETVLGETLGTAQYPKKIEDVDPTVDSKRLGRQIATTNGRIAFVDNVLIPFNVADALSEAGVTLPLVVREGTDGIEMVFKPFRSLVNFVTSRTDLTILATLAAGSELLLDVLSNSAALHVFAPTDESFLKLAEALVPEDSDVGLLPAEGEGAVGNVTEMAAFAGRLADTWALLEDVPSLEEIVAYHVLGSSKSYEELVGSGPQETLFGGDARIEILDTGVKDDDEDRDDALRIASFATGNGFVTVIDGVLLPFAASAGVEAVAAAVNSGDGGPSASDEPTETEIDDGGEVGDDDAVCFPAHATVRLADGSHKRMDELSAGDKISVSSDEHSEVYLFTHRLHARRARFVTIETDCGRSVTLTASHYLYADGKLASAGAVKVGETLETDAGVCRVVKTSNMVGRGLFAPHTMHGDLVVDGVRVSSYSTAVEPRFAHWGLALVRVLVRMGVKEPLRGWFDAGAPRLAALLPKGYERY